MLNIHQCACISLFIYTLYSIIMLKKEISIQICKLGNAMNANEVYPWMLMRKCLLVMLIQMLHVFILMLILIVLNLNTGYADTDANLCFRILSWCSNLGDFNFASTAKFDCDVTCITAEQQVWNDPLIIKEIKKKRRIFTFYTMHINVLFSPLNLIYRLIQNMTFLK